MQNKTLQMKRALRTALLVLLLSTVGMGNVVAQPNYDFSAVCETGQTLYYNIIDANVEITHPNMVYYNGWDGYTKPTGDLTIPAAVTYNGRNYSVTQIDNWTFDGCDGLTSLIIPSSVESLGSYSFYMCGGLASVSIPNTLTSIGTKAFANCGLTSVTIPNSVSAIGESAFIYCRNLTQVNWNAVNVTDYPEYISYGHDNPPFKDCYNLSTVIFGDSVQTIPNSAFRNLQDLTSVTIGKSVSSVGEYAFANCSGLTMVNYTGTLSQWCGIDFSNSTSNPCFLAHNFSINGTPQTELVIPSDVTRIKDYSFNGCSNFTSLYIPNSVTTIGTNAFYGFDGTFVVIPKSVNSISTDAFGNCARLTTVYYDAENATGSSAFPNCPNLTTIHIGADVQEIHPVFSGCSSVHLVVALGPTPAVLESNALTDIAENSILMVSCGSKLNYFSVWNMFEFNNIMEDCGEYSISMSGIGTGGNVTASATNAQMGQEVQLTVTPNAGMILYSISVCNATDPAQTIPVYPIGKGNKYGFIMPPFGVSVAASFAVGTSVGESSGVSVAVYPNPTNGQVTIEAENLKHITISNMLGQTIYDGNASGNEFTYDFSKHNAGIYLIRIETSNGATAKKVSVTR